MMNQVGDVVLVYYQDRPAVFARIESIEPDIKKDWYHITLLLLTIPTQAVTWILKGEYINGSPFTMGGTSMRMEKVESVSIKNDLDDSEKTDEKEHVEKTGTVLPFIKPQNKA